MGRKPSRDSVRLTSGLLVVAAADLADEWGDLNQVTLAQLASQFEIRVPSLYNHIVSLDGLRREVALLSLRELMAHIRQVAVGKAGGEALRAIAHAYRDFAKRFPGRYSATLRAPDSKDKEMLHAAQELNDLLMLALTQYRLNTNDALHVIRALRSLAHGFVSLEAIGGFGLALDRDESFRRLVQTFTDGLISASRPLTKGV